MTFLESELMHRISDIFLLVAAIYYWNRSQLLKCQLEEQQ